MKNILRRIPVLFLYLILLSSSSVRVNAQINNTNPETNDSSPYKVYLPFIATEPGSVAGVYYLSPSGNDSNSGKTESQAWATFDRALSIDNPGNKLQPGDTLVLLDGIYRQSISPYGVSGSADGRITIRALNDGKVVIDGERQRVPVDLTEPYFDVEGIIFKNSSESVLAIHSSNNIFRRISGYNANTDGNSHVFEIVGSNNLIEDCVASGSGRKMILIFSGLDPEGQHNTIRRCFASYREQDERQWGDAWPWNENYEAYSADYNTFENDIAYGYFAYAGFSLLAQGGGDTNIGNKVLGSITIMGDTDFLGNPIHWGNIRPQPTEYSDISSQYEPCQRTGIFIGHGSTSIIQDNLIQDVLSWGNASVGICVAEDPQLINNKLNRVSIYNNGLDMPGYDFSVDARSDDLANLEITNSRIDVIKPDGSPITGEGARLRNRYIDGVLKDGSDGSPAQPLWPWPMEQRIRDELGISVTNLIAGIIPNQVDPIPDANRPFLAVSPAIQAFGSVGMGKSVSSLITLKNIGTGSLLVEKYQFGGSSSDFSLTSGGTCPTPPYDLAPGQTCTINISFSPIDTQLQSDDLYFYSPDIAIYPAPPSVYLSGVGQ